MDTKEKDIVNLLTGGSEKYWTLVREYPVVWYTGIVYKSDGTFVPYTIQDNRSRIISNVFNKNHWKLLNDSTISKNEGHPNLRIIYINDEVMVLNNLSLKETLVYVKSPDQFTKPIPDKPKFPTQ